MNAETRYRPVFRDSGRFHVRDEQAKLDAFHERAREYGQVPAQILRDLLDEWLRDHPPKQDGDDE